MTLWKKCIEEMPPNDKTTIIARPVGRLSNRADIYYNSLINHFLIDDGCKSAYEWTLYDKELWEELSR